MILNPVETSHFGTIEYGDTKVSPMQDLKIYKEDTLGLRSLDEQGKLHLKTIEKKGHTIIDLEWIVKEVFPCLYQKSYK